MTDTEEPDQQRLWDTETARAYDTPGEGMFAPGVLGPTVELLAHLAQGTDAEPAPGDGSAVEFAIGTGRVAIPLREAGVEVSGVELSEAMIARLREKTDPDRIPVVHGDMTTADAGTGHALVYLVFNTIGNLLTQQAQVACFRSAARHLAAGGRFVVEMMVPQLRYLAPGRRGTVEVSEEGYLLVDTYDPLAQILVSHHVHFDPTVDGSRSAQLGRTPQRYIWPGEMDLMAQIAGFSLESRWADWDRSPFTADSRSHVSVYRLDTSVT